MRITCGTILAAAVAVAGGAEARRNAGQPPRLPLIVGFALEYYELACSGFVNSRRLASPRSKERMESARTRWFASEKNGSGASVITSKGRRRRITIWRRNSLTPLEMSSPARLSNSSASWRRSESMRICNVDVAMLKSFVVRLNDIVPYHQSYYNRATRQSDGISFGYGDPCGVMARTREQKGKTK